MIVSRSTTAVPRLTGGRPSKEILIIEATIRNPIFMFGGAPQAHVELRSFWNIWRPQHYKDFVSPGLVARRQEGSSFRRHRALPIERGHHHSWFCNTIFALVIALLSVQLN